MNSNTQSERPLFPDDSGPDCADQFPRASEDVFGDLVAAEENRHHRVANEFIHIATGGDDRIRLQGEKPVQFAHQIRGFARLAPTSEAAQIGEQDGTLNPMAGARAEAERAANFYRKLGIADRIQFAVHPGGHEFDTKVILDFFSKHL